MFTYAVHFIAVATTATPFASPSSPVHSLSARTHTPSLSLTHSHYVHLTHTHLTHLSIPERGYATLSTIATADAGDPSTECEPPPLSLKLLVWKYFGYPVSLTTFQSTKKPQFASSAETRWGGYFV